MWRSSNTIRRWVNGIKKVNAMDGLLGRSCVEMDQGKLEQEVPCKQQKKDIWMRFITRQLHIRRLLTQYVPEQGAI